MQFLRNHLSRTLYLVWTLALLLWVSPGWSAVSVEVEIDGLSSQQKNNALGLLTIQQQKDHPLTSDAFIKRAHRKAPGEIKQALEPFGYYQVEVTSELTKTAEGYKAHYRVDIGKPIRIETLDLTLDGDGQNDPVFIQLINTFPLKENDVLEHALYENGKNSLLQDANERGYLDAEFTRHELRIDLQAYKAQVILHFNTGSRYKFGEIRFHQDILKPGFLDQFAPVKENEDYSVVNMLALQKALSDSSYFSRVEVTPQIKQAQDRKIPIDVTLTPRKRNRYSAGIGYGTDTGARLIAGWENRRINQRGHRMDAELLVSEIKNSETLRYTIPLDFYQADQLALTANRYNKFQADRDEKARTLSISRSRGKELLRTTTALTYTEEEFTIADVYEVTRLLMPSISWSWIDTDDRIHTTHGKRYIFDLRGAHSAVLSDITFIQAQAQGKWISQYANSSRLITRATVGHTKVGEFSELPSSLRFFTGGDKTIRGYSYESIAPQDVNGNIIGGTSLLVGSIEYEYPIVGKWTGAVFYDAGNAFDEWNTVTPLKRGAGIGARWSSPIGPIRMDIAWPQGEPDKSWRLHLVIGPDL